MRKYLVLLAPLLLIFSFATGCKDDSSSADKILTSADCPTSNTKNFAKTRFAANVGITAGSFHRYIYKPYKAGTFKKGADGRIRAIVKAGATALLIKHQLGNAIDNAKANPTLCKLLIAPLSKLQSTLSGLKSKILKGDTSVIDDMNDQVSAITTGSSQNGVDVTEQAA